MELGQALLLATLTVINPSAAPTVSQISNVVPDASECRSAMRSVVEHNGLVNHIFSTTKEQLRARKGNVSLVVTCKLIKGK